MSVVRKSTTRSYVELGTDEAPALIRWSVWWSRPGNYDSYALSSSDGAVLIDPVEPEGEAADDLWRRLGAKPAAIVLTNDYHERDAYEIGKRFGAPVWAPAAGLPERGGEMEGTPDRAYEDGATLPGGMRAFAIRGKFAGDTVLAWQAPAGEHVLFTGDAINGHFNPANPLPHPRRGEPGLYLGAGPFYITDLDTEALKTSLRRVLAVAEVDLICGAHGEPVRVDAKRALQTLTETDWTPFLREKTHPVVR